MCAHIYVSVYTHAFAGPVEAKRRQQTPQSLSHVAFVSQLI